jgi:hypothetical protein
MPVDFTAREDRPAADPNGSAFAPVPTFAQPNRGKKRRSRAKTEPPMVQEPAITPPEAMVAKSEAMMNTPPESPLGPDFAASQDFARTPRTSRKLPTAVLIAAPAAVLLAGAAFLMTQPRGEPVNPAPMGPAPVQTSEAAPPPVNPMPEIAPPAPAPTAAQAAPETSPAGATPPRRETRTARARPAPRAPAAEDNAAAASATVPSAPRDRSDLVVNPMPVVIPPVAAPPTPSTAPQTPTDLPPTTPIPEISGESKEVLPDSSASTP